MNSKQNSLFIFLAFILVFFGAFGTKLFVKVDAGHVGVATVFGKLVEEPFREGLHISPKYVLYKWHKFDVRERTHFERAKVPSQDQLQTDLELSVQWRVSETFAAQMLRETGNAERAIEVHMVPKVRSLLREQGKSIKRSCALGESEKFFTDIESDTAGFMKMVPSVYTLLINTIYLSLSTPVNRFQEAHGIHCRLSARRGLTAVLTRPFSWRL